MRLLYVVHQFFPDCHSGTEQYCLSMARQAQRNGDEVTVLSLHWDHDRDWPPVKLFEQPYDGVPVLRLNHWRRQNPNDVLRDYENLHLEGWFRAVLERVRPDAVHFFHLRQLGSNLIAVAKSFPARTVVNLMDFWFLCPRFTLQRGDGSLCDGPPDGGKGCVACEHPGLRGVEPAVGEPLLTSDPPMRLLALLRRQGTQAKNLGLADAVVAPSRFLAGMFRKNGFPTERMQVVPYGLPEGRIRPLPAARPRTPLRLGFCGVLSPWKAPHLAVEAVLGSKAAIALCVHGRLQESMFQGYIDQMVQSAAGDPRITFAGAYGQEQAAEVFADMDALVVPSVWYENTPFVVLEAFAAGVPVVASDLGGLSEIVHDGKNGLLFRAGDAGALRAAIERLAADPELCRRLQPSQVRSAAQDYAEFRRLYQG